MHKWIMFSLFVIAGAVAIIFTVDKAMEPAENAEEPVGANELRLSGKNWEFDKDEYTVAAGVPIKISYRNAAGGGFHGMAIEGTDVKLDDGETTEFTFEPGEYTIYCTILCGDGHDTMVSKLIVTADAGE